MILIIKHFFKIPIPKWTRWQIALVIATIIIARRIELNDETIEF